MECDFCFEDSVFSETRERTGQKGLSYTARQCEPRWFAADVEELVEAHTVLKFRADLSYRREDYEAKGVGNTDHLTGVLNLQATIHNHLGNLQEEMSCLQQLISLHPFNPHFWVCLAESYRSHVLAITNCRGPSHGSDRLDLCSQTSPGAPQCTQHMARTRDANVSRDNVLPRPCNKRDTSSLTAYTDREELWMWSGACFIRARLLLQLIQPQHASFVLERNMKTQEQIEKQLENIGLLEEQKMLIVEVMGEDLLAERTKEEGQTDTKTTQTLASFIMPSDEEFKVRWFQKMTALLMTSK
ncbi:uncharacterized protein C8orf76-like isoform 2-T2 [Anomaloglossus baeobatrachus]|uniref:uncharacterized protein C8orf76 homolog isoform X2 n=1 Tax=Anomaloglossus baeobatrachus TaxID=238106 RepID=UPI003F4F425C